MPIPTMIEVRKSERVLRITFDDGRVVNLDFDRLRNHSPAADGKPATPSVGVDIESVDQVGNYAILPRFSDGHSSGIYGWELLYRLGKEA